MTEKDHSPRIVVRGMAGSAWLAERAGHVMPASLVGSQLHLLEPLRADEAGPAPDLGRPASDPVDEFSDRFGAPVGAALSGGTR